MQDSSGPLAHAVPPDASQARLIAIRSLNDRLRISGVVGVVVKSDGVAGYDVSTANGIFSAVAQFADF